MKRNGKIELMRFVFCMCVLVFHINSQVWNVEKTFNGWLTLCEHGYLGVEFFLIVSGFLMARTIHRQLEQERLSSDPPALEDSTLRFLWRKIQSLLPYHLICCAVMAVLIVVSHPDNWLDHLLRRLPSLFFLQRLGFSGENAFLPEEWYISSMLLSMAILYPLCKRHFRFFSRLAAPLTGLLLIGYLGLARSSIQGATADNGITYYCNFRAIGEICLGICCYQVYLWLKEQKFSFRQKLLLTCLEAGGYLVTLLEIFCGKEQYSVYIPLFLCVSITIGFSAQGLFGESRLFQNPVCLYLGQLSLPIYLFQRNARWIMVIYLSFLRKRDQALVILLITLAASILLHQLQLAWQKRRAARA